MISQKQRESWSHGADVQQEVQERLHPVGHPVCTLSSDACRTDPSITDPSIIPAKACKHLHVFGLCWRRCLPYENILQLQLKSSSPASLSFARSQRQPPSSLAFPRESQQRFFPGGVHPVKVLKYRNSSKASDIVLLNTRSQAWQNMLHIAVETCLFICCFSFYTKKFLCSSLVCLVPVTGPHLS